jgi:Transposase, Mutator family
VAPRVSPTEAIRAEIHELFACDGELLSVIEQVARLSVRLTFQSVVEEIVCEELGRDRYQRRTADSSQGYRNGWQQPRTLNTSLGPVQLQRPKLRRPAELVHDPVAAREAYALVEEVGWVKAAKQTRVARRTLRASFARWGLGEPTPPPSPFAPSPMARDRAAAEAALELAIRVGVSRAAEELGVNRVTLYLAWRRWGWGGRPTGPRAPGRRQSGCWRPRAAPTARGIRGRRTARCGSPSSRPVPVSGRRLGWIGDRAPVSGLAAPEVEGERPG